MTSSSIVHWLVGQGKKTDTEIDPQEASRCYVQRCYFHRATLGIVAWLAGPSCRDGG